MYIFSKSFKFYFRNTLKGVGGSVARKHPARSRPVARRALSWPVMERLKAFVEDAKQHVTSCIPISPSRADARSATLDENAAPEPRPTQATPASAASPCTVQPAAAAAAGPVQPASSIVVGSQVVRGPDWKWGKQVCKHVARHASAHACCMRACAHLRLRSWARLPRAGLPSRFSLRLDASSAERGLACSSHRMATRAITFRRSALCWK
jgi:hypothetical protein